MDVSESTIDRLLSAATRAPSAGNRQPWHFYIVRDASVRKALAGAACNQAFLGDAPMTIVVCTVPDQSAARCGTRGRELYAMQDAAAPVQNILLGSVALGLGACWVGAFDQQDAAIALNLAANQRPIAIVPVGNPVDHGPVSRTERPRIRNVVTNVA